MPIPCSASPEGWPADAPDIPAAFVPGGPVGPTPNLGQGPPEKHGRPERDWGLYEHAVRLEASTTLELGDDDNPDNVVQEVHINIITSEGEAEAEAGEAALIIVHADRCEDRPLFDVMDATSQTAMEYYETFYDPHGDFRSQVRRQFRPGASQDLLILDIMFVEPRFRGRKLGLLVADQILEVYGYGLGLAACKPFPPQYAPDEGAVPRTGFPKGDLAADKNRLRHYWEKLGFRQLGRTDYYALNLELRRERDFLKA